MSRRRLGPLVVLFAALGVLANLACTPPEGEEQLRGQDELIPPAPAIPAPLPAAYCEILVEGDGVKDMETDYLPRVITCENGGANLEALKAQAIAARSVAYYAMAKDGSICDSQGCQVYSCNAEPGPKAYQAVAETSGLYLNYNSTLTYAFYVAGDPNTSPPACVGNVNVGTEHWVTYNEGNAGTNVVQTELGWVFEPNENGYGQNRGCMSQWGARCLENNNGYGYEDILRFYYGDDIEIIQAQGPCVEEIGDGDGDPDPSTSGDGDGDPTTTTGETETDTTDTTGDESGPDPEPCAIGSLGCECTMGGGCDPGLVCEDDYCVPEGPNEPEDTSAGSDSDSDSDSTTGLTGFSDDAFDAEQGCACSADAEAPRDAAPLGLLALAGLLGLRRRRD